MSRKKTSVIWKVTLKALQRLLDSSSSFVEVLKKLKLSPYNGNHQTLNKRLTQEGDKLSLTRLNENRKILRAKHARRSKVKLEDVIAGKRPGYNMNHFKKRLVEEGFLKNVCKSCEIPSEWNGKPLSLQLHHIDGEHSNNSLENLALLCPNCHSQTPTYGGKNTAHKCPDAFCVICNSPVHKKGAKCRSCASKLINEKRRKFFLTKPELEALIWEMPMVEIAKKLQVSDRTVENWRVKLKVSKPPIGYWLMPEGKKQKIQNLSQ